MEKAEVTLKSLAKELGLSISTVSRALRNHPDVNTETKKKVMELATDLDYEPNILALNLLKKRANTIGVIVPYIGYHLYARAISGIENVANKAGYNIIICQSNESFGSEAQDVKDLISGRVAGFIISLSSETEEFSHFKKIIQKGTPLVFFNRECEEIDTSKVVIDNYEAAYEATEHLISVGCKRVAYLGGPDTVQISNKRLEGYKAALKKNGQEIDESLFVHCGFSREETMTGARKMLFHTNPPDAVLAYSDQMAISMMLVAKERGLQIPQELCVIGFNNEPVCELIEPALTSISQPSFQMGEIAAQRLLEQINASEESPFDPQKDVLKSKLIIRGSTNRHKKTPSG
ncbi:LacI family DNA-binding transcriptional regulator [Flammeovirgaceae bacterium SG7u.111]|nr:LacI family DNA-binding transcriptional regulator [Flammeovirgaceae bacterium SG7u.132]WPO37552.1 LacI family DNA-binding transcriptional regulator [Flammeovirgaceae bacterium SG7u.111]